MGIFIMSLGVACPRSGQGSVKGGARSWAPPCAGGRGCAHFIKPFFTCHKKIKKQEDALSVFAIFLSNSSEVILRV